MSLYFLWRLIIWVQNHSEIEKKGENIILLNFQAENQISSTLVETTLVGCKRRVGKAGIFPKILSASDIEDVPYVVYDIWSIP